MELMIPVHTEPLGVAGKAGSIRLGWVTERVLYARLRGEMSPELGALHGAKLHGMTALSSCIRYFVDASALTAYDARVRDAFASFVLARPYLFSSITILITNNEILRTAEPLVDLFGDILFVTTERMSFERRLFFDAPCALAAPVLGTWVA
jgi:hypothetical protein